MNFYYCIENISIIGKGNHCIRKVLESWLTMMCLNVDLSTSSTILLNIIEFISIVYYYILFTHNILDIGGGGALSSIRSLKTAV